MDRAALDVAIEFRIPIGGWCPKGRLAEDGPIPKTYPLRETATTDTAVRTELNVIDSDGTLILTCAKPRDGTGLTIVCAEHHGCPYLLLDLDRPTRIDGIAAWVLGHRIQTLNIAGPRESHRPGFIYKAASELLRQLLTQLGETAPANTTATQQ